ncbi:MAG TPA: UDP-N-acetylglucosamine 1-carboxyvinyltransferase [Bdellovibrionales bacterium]|nr:UDP-N-acetylglucosamine 1-carboxyvinyltransferase [Bdellovibrionales bacterium]
MDKLQIIGGAKLNGTVAASGAKNAALPLMFATLLAEGEHVFHNVPFLKDIESACELLESLGCKCTHENHTLRIRVEKPKTFEAHYDLVRKMRASILCLGPLVAKYGQARVSLPGGCAIGTRPIDLHLFAMTALGTEITLDSGYVNAKTKKLQGQRIIFENVTVGGTENALMAATLAEGKTTIENAAQEPEIVDLAEYLIKMGAKIKGAGTRVIEVEGVKSLKPTEHIVLPDRIEAGTLLIAGAITGGNVTVQKCRPEHFAATTEKMREAGFEITSGPDWISVAARDTWKGVDVTTAPFPGFATDLQAQFMALMTIADGPSVITETIFENRYMHVQELVRLSADITLKGQTAIVKGRPGILQGAPVMATDLRASACLVLAGLAAKGETVVNRIYHLDRGYENLEKKLASLGAKIKRVE